MFAVGTEDIRHVENFAIFQPLLHAAADGMVVVLCLKHGETNARLVRKDVVSFFRLAASGRLSTDNHATFREINFLANLIHHIPFAARRQRRGDELGADVLLRQGFFIKFGHDICGASVRGKFRRVNFLKSKSAAQKRKC